MRRTSRDPLRQPARPSIPPHRPLVFAHRGSSERHPEHTLGAYLQAIADGADGLECDVRLTRDGHLVCLHDRRLERTSNGRGLVSRHTLAELNELDFASWHRAEPVDDPILDRPAAGILTLDRLLEAARDADRPVQLLIETKHPTRHGAMVEAAVVAALRRHGLDRPDPAAGVQVTVMSFSVLAVRRVRRMAPELPVVMLMELLPPGLRGGRLPFGVRIGGPGINLLRARPEIASRLRARGHRVFVWTVNDPADVDLVTGLGVDGIITDRPDAVVRRLGELGAGG